MSNTNFSYFESFSLTVPQLPARVLVPSRPDLAPHLHVLHDLSVVCRHERYSVLRSEYQFVTGSDCGVKCAGAVPCRCAAIANCSPVEVTGGTWHSAIGT